MGKIEKYINEIRYDKIFDINTYKEKKVFYFSGDGEGDFEHYEKETTIECLEEYIKHCKTQIELAEEYLKGIK